MYNRRFICVVCPLGCELSVEPIDSGYKVLGNKCSRGTVYAIEEMTNPTRTVTTTIKLFKSKLCRLPVKTSQPFPKGKIFELMNETNKIELSPPICRGQIVCRDMLGTGIDLLATKTVKM